MKFFAKFIRGRGFSMLFMLFSALSVFYVSNRMGRFLQSIFHHDFQFVVLFLLLVLMGYMTFYLNSKKERKATRNLYEICSVILCFLLYLVLFLWVYDIGRALFTLQDQLYIVPILGSVILTFYGFIHAKKLYVKEYPVSLPGIKTIKKLVLLSDIHVGTFVDLKQLTCIVEKVNSLKPDMVLIAGDMFDVEAFAYCDKEAIAEILQKLEPHKKTYAILGNHDPKSTEKEIWEFYKEAGIHLLVDEAVETEELILIGRDDRMTNPERKSLQQLKKDGEFGKTEIVLDHNPAGIKEAAACGSDLILCGHTHRGQFFPANIFTRLAYDKQGYYGYGKKGKTQSVVSSGVGYFQMPMRVGSNSEIVVLDLE